MLDFDLSVYNFEETPAMASGRRYYEEEIKPRHGDAIGHQLVVVHPETGDYEIDADYLAAVKRYDERFPGGHCVYVLEEQLIPGTLGGFGIVAWAAMTPAERALIPSDSAHNLNHYLYGHPKRPPIV